MAEIWGAAIGAAAGIYSAKQGSKAAKKAANAQAGAADEASKVTWDMYAQNRRDQQPFYQGGVQAFDEYRALMGLPGQMAGAQPLSGAGAFDPEQAYLDANPDVAASGMSAKDHFSQYGRAEGRQWGMPAAPQGGAPGAAGTSTTQAQAFERFRSAPGYQFGLDEGRKTVEAGAAARGGLNSGAALKELTRFGQNYADQQGFTPHMNRLAGLFGGAQTSANQMGAYGQNAAAQIGQNTMAAGNARAQGIYDGASAQSNGVNQLSQAFGQWYGGRNKSINGGFYLGNQAGRG